ncbi:hypothetical protein GQ53DRAFT_827005 [Thozetella sp. PMI_491]|nr:hypothetical protein GQ53DRAFT_827005 [Thozetella sp. PMI_491]
MAYRSSAIDLGRSERWDRDRFHSERERYGDVRERYEEEDRYYSRGPPLRSPERVREHSVDAHFERRYSRPQEEEVVYRDRRVTYDDEPRYMRRSPPVSEVDRRVVIQKERVRSPSPRRPGLLRRQSSLDTFDRRPRGYYEREEYGPPARINREEFRPPNYVPIPLPRARALPPPRRYAEREYYDEIQVSDPHYYGDDDFHAYPERVREKEIIRTRRRNRSRESRGTSRHGSTIRSSSRSSSVTSSSSSSSGGTTVKSEYPKKGKTRIPSRLVSKRALIDMGYPFIEEGNTIVVQKALGQENIDDLLKLSEDYKKSELELVAARSSAGDIVEEREVFEREVVVSAPAPPPPPPVVIPVAPPMPVMTPAIPPPPPVEVVNTTTVVRELSPARSYTTSTSATPVVVDARPREISDEIPVGPLALVTAERHRSRDRSDIRSEIRHLERELARREHRHHDRDIVKAERLSTGELVLYEEKVEEVIEPRRGVRIEKDKKGRMSISVPKYSR